jgi:uncharacterized phiE125 gp8 family phage protein
VSYDRAEYEAARRTLRDNLAPALTAAPDTLPLTVAQVLEHLGRDEDDDVVERWIAAAVAQFQFDTGRALITQAYDLVMDAAPCERVLLLPKPPLQSVEMITVYDVDDVATELDDADYIVDTSRTPGRITLKSTVTAWSTAILRDARAFVVSFTSGYGDAASNVPADIRGALLWRIGSYAQHREDVMVSQFAGQFLELPDSYKSTVARYGNWI